MLASVIGTSWHNLSLFFSSKDEFPLILLFLFSDDPNFDPLYQKINWIDDSI
jgi:hypothetical protein